jgi:hypothetical protein
MRCGCYRKNKLRGGIDEGGRMRGVQIKRIVLILTEKV